MDGILLIGHGSLVPGANESLYEVAQAIRERLGAEVVEVAFLDQSTPNIPAGVLTCVKQGVTCLNVIPYFLTDGYLVRKAERVVRKEVSGYRGMTLRFGDPIGLDKRLVKVIQDRIEGALADKEESS